MQSQQMTADEIYQRGLEIYESKLRKALEPAFDGEQIAIAIEDGDYETGGTIAEADERLRKRHPDAVFFYGRVGGDHAVRWSGGYADVLAGKP